MVTPLTRQQCEALRDAGYPQTAAATGCYSAVAMDYECKPDTYWRVWNGLKCDAGYHDYDSCWLEFDPRTDVACPNSDELLAAIRERWPSYNYVVSGGSSFTLWAALARQFGSTVDIAHGEGESPVSALAALYIARAAQEPPC